MILQHGVLDRIAQRRAEARSSSRAGLRFRGHEPRHLCQRIRGGPATAGVGGWTAVESEWRQPTAPLDRGAPKRWLPWNIGETASRSDARGVSATSVTARDDDLRPSVQRQERPRLFSGTCSRISPTPHSRTSHSASSVANSTRSVFPWYSALMV